MRDYTKFYINGKWLTPSGTETLEVINPATERVSGRISMGNPADVDAAVAAARKAFLAWSEAPLDARLAVMMRIIELYQSRMNEIAEAITTEMGAPHWLAAGPQAQMGLGHLVVAADAIRCFAFHEDRGASRVQKEPIGVCGFITPWNWPMNQITAKFAPAMLTGCTIVHKPSELAPYSAYLFAEICDAAGLPAGVYNLVNGEGPVVGAAIAAHRDVDMVSFTGSTRAGIEVARAAAPTVKRVHQELGGKSPNVILDDADLDAAITASVAAVMMNSGQTCVAPTRLLAPRTRIDEIVAIAKVAAEAWAPGDPATAQMGPVVSAAQRAKIRRLIDAGVAEGATLVTGGAHAPDGLETGYFVRPTVFTDVRNDMTIAREEIFGPVLVIIPYDTEQEAVAIANDTEYGLAASVHGADLDRARNVASKIRAGYVTINGADFDISVPFGGYKKSGNGREFGHYAFDEFLEVKSIMGHNQI